MTVSLVSFGYDEPRAESLGVFTVTTNEIIATKWWWQRVGGDQVEGMTQHPSQSPSSMQLGRRTANIYNDVFLTSLYKGKSPPKQARRHWYTHTLTQPHTLRNIFNTNIWKLFLFRIPMSLLTRGNLHKMKVTQLLRRKTEKIKEVW